MSNTVFDILRRPVVTEKSNYLAGKLNQYVFEVASYATREQVKTAMAKHLSPEAMLIVSAGPTVAQQPLPPPTERPTAQPTGVPEH